MDICAQQAEVIRCWETIERFNPQNVPSLGQRRVVDLDRRRPLPWDPTEDRRRGPAGRGRVWRHSLYVGVYPLGEVDEVLEASFGHDEWGHRSRAGSSALAAFDVADDGIALTGSLVISSSAWATGRVLRPGPSHPEWLRGFEEREAQVKAVAAHYLAPRPLTLAQLESLRDELAEQLGVEGVLSCRTIRVRTVAVKRRRAATSDVHDFLNSFIAGDLRLVAGPVADDRLGSALATYLSPPGSDGRLDVRQDLDAVRRRSAPGEIPLGRWPSRPDQPLALGQQLAVNVAMSGGPGLLGVNGPPGTGKTTIMRELVAGVVVERARALARLAAPSQAFRGASWVESLHGFELVVASSNNAAVQNVVDELPTATAVDGRFRRDVPELLEIAAALLRVDDADDDTDEDGDEPPAEVPVEAWALIAARLGRMEHRHRFVSRFWWGDRDESNDTEPRRPRMPAILAELRLRRRPWAESVARFNAALARADRLATERQRAHDAIDALVNAESEAIRCERLADEQECARAALEAQLATAMTTETQRRLELDAVRQREVDHRRWRSRSPMQYVPFGHRATEWRAQRAELARGREAAQAALDEAQRDVARCRRESAAHAASAGALRARARDAWAVAAEHRPARNEAARRWSDAVPSAGWAEQVEWRELTALWNDPEWNAARTEVFLAALELHRDFLAVAPPAFERSLELAIRIVGNDAADVSAERALNAWRSLFFVVPLVSTTFASFGRLLSHLGAESLGWLLIDEAGQATPQQAVGAIWRARRVVAVGDPMQLEPIVTLSERAQDAIATRHGVERRWLPGSTSVERIADERSVVGTLLPSGTGDVWVGAPLRVHRRCDEPMFGIINAIAYGGQMINGVGQRPPTSLPTSRWLDVPGRGHGHNAIEAEHAVLADLLAALIHDHQLDTAELFLVSPFRDVADQFADDLVTGFAGLTIIDRRDIIAGTAHASQGRERDVVILVLGGTPGARRWAAEKPNLLNVAVSRARRRLYVIGDRSDWKHRAPWFGELADRLPVDELWT